MKEPVTKRRIEVHIKSQKNWRLTKEEDQSFEVEITSLTFWISFSKMNWKYDIHATESYSVLLLANILNMWQSKISKIYGVRCDIILTDKISRRHWNER